MKELQLIIEYEPCSTAWRCACHGMLPQASPAWVWNHYRWIVWKLAAEERVAPKVFPTASRLNWSTVLHQLLYRYEREFNVRKRPLRPSHIAVTRRAVVEAS